MDLVRMDLWRERSLFHRQVTRPVIGEQSTLFPLSGLVPGAYIVTFQVGDRVVAYRSFSRMPVTQPRKRAPAASHG
jgi:hypothetical protein